MVLILQLPTVQGMQRQLEKQAEKLAAGD
uniref:Uncharacterized protein n=1 Tax=Arundo donax TaxID=35708 RepID=A0A0A9HNG3_ARUDO